MATRNNTVPLGQAGTGAAFLLGGSKALDNWMAQDQKNAQVRDINRQNQQTVAKNYNANKLKTPLGQRYQAEIMGDVEKLNEVGAQYLAKGFDIYNPNFRDENQVAAHNQFMQDRAVLETKIEARKRFEEAEKADRTEYRKNPYGFDNTPDDVFPQYEKANSLGDIVNKGLELPTLQRTFDYNKNVKDQIPVIKPNVTERLEGNERIIEETVNLPVITAAAERVLTAGQNRNWVEKQIGGSMDGLLKTTDPNAIKKALDSEFRSPTGIDMMAELAVKGKVPAFGTPQYDKFLDEAVKEQLKAEQQYDKILSDAVQIGMEKSDPTYKRVPDFSLATQRRATEDQAMQRERMSLAREANSRAQTRMSDYIAKKKEDKSYDSFLKDVVDTKPTAIKELNSVIDEIGGKARKVYDETLTIDGKKVRVKNAVVVDVPVETTVDARDSEGNKIENNDGSIKKVKTTVNKRYVLGRSGGKSAEVVLNQILNRTTSFGASKQNTVLPYNENESPTIEDWEE